MGCRQETGLFSDYAFSLIIVVPWTKSQVVEMFEDETIEEKIIVHSDLDRPLPMDDLERRTMFKPVDNFEAKEIISSDLKKYRIVRSKTRYCLRLTSFRWAIRAWTRVNRCWQSPRWGYQISDSNIYRNISRQSLFQTCYSIYWNFMKW